MRSPERILSRQHRRRLMRALSVLLPVLFLIAQGPIRAAQIAAQALENLVNISFETDVRVFAVMAALNAAGFEAEAEPAKPSGIHGELKKALASVDPGLLSELRDFYHRTIATEPLIEQQVIFTSLALILSGSPDFELKYGPDEEMPGQTGRIRGWEQLVKRLYANPQIQRVWRRHHPDYIRELAGYRPVLKDIIRETLEYFRIPPRIVLDRRIVMIPDLLNLPDVVNSRGVEGTYYIVVGPTDDPASNYLQLQHAYLHFLLDPLIEKYAGSLLRHVELLTLAQRQPRIKSEYQNRYELIVTESLIETVQLKLHPPEDLQLAQLRLFRQGLIFVPFFFRELSQFEQTDFISMPAYVELMIERLDAEEVRADAGDVAEWEERVRQEHARNQATESEQRREAETRRTVQALLEEAANALSHQDLEAAREALKRTLELDSESGSAFFYLAQISAQEGAHNQAYDYYAMALNSPRTPLAARAWSMVRMGRILAHRGEFERASAMFRAVLEMEGDLGGARKEAEDSLELLAQAPRPAGPRP